MGTVYRAASDNADEASVDMGDKTSSFGGFSAVFTRIEALRVFGNIIKSMRTDAFLYKTT
jgi:hypothetical protein